MSAATVTTPTDSAPPSDVRESHIGYEWSDVAFCGAVFVFRTYKRPTDRPVCPVCDLFAKALA